MPVDLEIGKLMNTPPVT